MQSLSCTLDAPNLFACFIGPGGLFCASFDSDGNVTTSSMQLAHTASSCDFCLLHGSDGIIVLSGNGGCQIVNVKDGATVPETLSKLHSVKSCSQSQSLFVKDRRLICEDDSLYVSDPIQIATRDSMQNKSKISINSEIGPQNRLLLSKDKSVVRSMYRINADGTDVIIVTTSKNSQVLFYKNYYLYRFFFPDAP